MDHLAQRILYEDCIAKQLEEIDLLSSIYCNPGEMHIFDPGVIADFNEFIASKSASPQTLRAHLDFTITICAEATAAIKTNKNKIEIRIELPHLYPAIENAIVSIRSALLIKQMEIYIKDEIDRFIGTMEKNEIYIFQLLTWLQDQIDELIIRQKDKIELASASNNDNNEEIVDDFERLWIYSHHIKSKVKRQEIVRQCRDLDLTGFCLPGKPGVICVEGLRVNTQNFWKIIKAMHWQKITIRKSEVRQKQRGEIDKLRRFSSFKEELYADNGDKDEIKMNMALFIKFLEMHNSGYIKKELFGIE